MRIRHASDGQGAQVRDGRLEFSAKWLQLRNPYAPIQVLDEEQIERIHDASMTVLEDVGMRIQDRQARDYFAAAGFSVDHPTERVHFDREGILELVAKAPSVASVRGGDSAKKLFMGEGQVAFTAVSGPPFVSDLDHGRRAGTFRDQENFLKMTHMTDVLQIEGGISVEAQDLPADTRYLDFYLSCCKLSDKPWKPLTIGKHRARDAIEMAKIWYGEDEESLAANPVFFVNTNTYTPLVLDGEIAQGVIEYAKLGQVVCVTPLASPARWPRPRSPARWSNGIWKQMVNEYEEPAIDPSVIEELEDFVARRKIELAAIVRIARNN